MVPNLSVRCERSVTGEVITRIFEHHPKYSSTVELHVGDDLVKRCSVLRDLKHVLGEAPLPQVDPQSFRLWILGDYDGHSVFRTALGALQIAMFLGDDRQETWAQIAGTLLFGCLTTDVRTCGTPAHVVNLVESLGDDVHQKLLSAAPLDCILAHFSRASHARAIQLRTHYDDHGPHLTVEVSERFSTIHAEALMAVLKSVPTAKQHVSVTVRPSWHAVRRGTSRPHPSLSTQASAAWGTPFVVPERWLSSVAAVAKALQVMPRLCHLYCNCCSLEAAAAAALPLNAVATLHLQENDLGQSVGFLEADTRKPLFDTFVRRLVTPDVSRLVYNTIIQELDLSSNNLGAAMVPRMKTPYVVWNRDLMLALNRMPNLVRLDLSNNQLSVADLMYLLESDAMHRGAPPEDTDAPPPDGPDEWLAGVPARVTLAHLEALNVSKNELCGSLHGLLDGRTGLTRLDLSDTSLRAANAVTLAPVLSRMTRMRWLSIGGNRITQRAAAPLGAAFAQMRSLQYLNMSGHVHFNFAGEGVRAMAPHLATLTALEHLDLSKQGMGEGGAEVIAGALAHLVQLTCLELSGNDMSETGALALRPALEQLSELVALGLADNRLSDAALTAVAHGVLRLPELRRVKVDGNPMTKWSWDWGKGFVGKDVLRRWLEPSALL